MAGRYTIAGIQRAARVIGCDAAAVSAVVAVESAGSGFLSDGRPRILFEAHQFSRLTGNFYDAAHPTLSSPTWNAKLYAGGAAEYQRLYAAVQLDGEAAVQACSWGLMQVMGFNWEHCGERSLHGFLLAMHHNEDVQLALAAHYIVDRDLAAALRQHDWAAFARGYNGPGYARNQYDRKLAAAYSAAGGRA
jgi:hypothetical protein